MKEGDVTGRSQGGEEEDPGKGPGRLQALAVGLGHRLQTGQSGVDELAGFGVGAVLGVTTVVVGRSGGVDLEVLLALGRTLVNLGADLGNLVVVPVVVVVVTVVGLKLVLGGIAAETFASNDGDGSVGEGLVVHRLKKGVVGLDGTGGVGEDAKVDGTSPLGAVGTDVGGLSVGVVVVIVVVLVERLAFGKAGIVEFLGLVAIVVVIVVGIALVAVTVSSVREAVHEAVLVGILELSVGIVVLVGVVVVVLVLARVLAHLLLVLANLLLHLLLLLHVRFEEFTELHEVLCNVMG